MNSIYLIQEYYTNGYNTDILNILSLYSILCAIFVIIVNNPIVSVLSLIGLFGGISSYLIIIGLSFIGLSYLIVYIGAVSILFLFILMLINIRISELESNTRNSVLLGIIIILLFDASFFGILPYNVEVFNYSFTAIFKYYYLYTDNINYELFDLYYVTSVSWDGYIAEMDHITNIGNIMYTNYNMWLIMASFILLLAMIGSIVITIKSNHESNK